MTAFVVAVLAIPLSTAAIVGVYFTQYRMPPRWRPVAVAVHFTAVTTIICTYAVLCLVEYRSSVWAIGGWIVFAAGSVVFWYAVRCHPTCLVPDEDRGVVSAGPYGRIRHPIYAGGLLGALGLIAVAPDWKTAVAWAVLAASMGVLLALEERELLSRFGRPYAEYRQQTHLLIPRVL
jgi:protein-S-isoprenylcysteine O-methyltransferase Ste14